MPPPDWKSAIEVFPPDWTCTDGAFWLAGWVTSAAGLVPVDVRAWLGGRPYLGLCGLPRADKEIDARGRAGPPQAGFSFLLQPGTGELRVEVCDQHGRWTELFRHAIAGPTQALAPAAPPSPLPLLRLLQARRNRPGPDWPALAREVLAAEEAVPLDVLPSPPFHGALEQLDALAPVQHNRLLVTGWLAHRTQRIAGLTAFLDTATPLPLVHGLSRPDAGALFAELVDGQNSRFAGYLELPAHLPRPLALRIFADLADGRRELVFTKRFRPVVSSGADADLPPFSPLGFVRAVWALRQAGWSRGQPVKALWPVLREAWHEYRAATPLVLGQAPAPEAPADSTRPRHITVITHNLNREGAPLIALEFARYLAAQSGWRVRVLSAQDGPLREAYADAGLAVELVDVRPLLQAGDSAGVGRALDALEAQLDLTGTDLVAANTMVAFWGILLAHRLRKPSILYTHESVSARRFFATRVSVPVIAAVESAFARATRVVFSAAASRQVHGALERHDHFRVIPGWIDVGRIKAYARTHSRDEARRQLGLPLPAVIFASIGSINGRKGQHILVEAIDLLLRGRPTDRPLLFLLVGAGAEPDPYLDVIRDQISRRGLAGVQIVRQVADSYAYFRAADIFVCPSLEEAFPRVVMEAAAFRLPVVSTDVNGIPEMLSPEDAWLVPPHDPAALAAGLQAALTAQLAGDDQRARRAHETVCARLDAAQLLRQHADFVAAVAALPVS